MVNSIINILDDAIDWSDVGFLRICLKSSTHSYTEGNIWSASYKVEKAPNHTSVESGIHEK
jgi:hypothetical protein